MVQVDTHTHWVVSKRHITHWAGAVILLVGLLLLGVILTREVWLTSLGELLIVKEKPRHADAIVIISQGIDDRPIFASELVASGYATLVITLGGPSPASGAGSTGAARDADILRNWGVPIENIVMLDDTDNLYDEAIRSRDALVSRDAKSALVVSDPINMRRMALIFGPIYGDANITFVPVANTYQGFNPKGWWRRETNALEVGLQYLKIGLLLPWR